MPLKIGSTYNIRGVGRVAIRRSKAKGKKKVAVRLSDGKRINFGAKGFTIGPNKPKGDRFCARSSGANTFGFNANTLARIDWHCRGKKTSASLPSSVSKVSRKRK